MKIASCKREKRVARIKLQMTSFVLKLLLTCWKLIQVILQSTIFSVSEFNKTLKGLSFIAASLNKNSLPIRWQRINKNDIFRTVQNKNITLSFYTIVKKYLLFLLSYINFIVDYYKWIRKIIHVIIHLQVKTAYLCL